MHFFRMLSNELVSTRIITLRFDSNAFPSVALPPLPRRVPLALRNKRGGRDGDNQHPRRHRCAAATAATAAAATAASAACSHPPREAEDEAEAAPVVGGRRGG